MNSKFNPTSADLAIAPRLERWAQIRDSKSTRLRGEVTGHPVLDDQRIFTSPLLVLDRCKQWARTTSRFYVLGEPAYRQPTELEIVRRRRQLQDHRERLVEEQPAQLHTLSDTPNIARAVALDQLHTAKTEINTIREQARQEGLKDAERSIQTEIDQRWAKHEERRLEVFAEAEERAWERVKRRIDEIVTERASERLQRAEKTAKVAAKREKALKRALDMLWSVLKNLIGREDLAAIKTAHEAELSKPAKVFKLRGPENF